MAKAFKLDNTHSLLYNSIKWGETLKQKSFYSLNRNTTEGQSHRGGDEIEKAEITSTFLGKPFQEELLRKNYYGERHDP